MIATIIIGVGGATSATIGADIVANLFITLQMPKAVATSDDGNRSMRHRAAGTQPMLTPNLVIMINMETKKGSECGLSYSKLKAPMKDMKNDKAKRGFIPTLKRTTPAPSFAKISATADVYELLKISPGRYLSSKLTRV